jgi:GR25 family glycosyltransferase involved in LPS biosynthesis
MLKKLMINLARRKDRLETHDLDSNNIDVIEAFDGKEMSSQDIMNVKVRNNWRDPFNNRRITKGECACFLSHRQCWETIAKGDKPVLVLEDDIVFTEHYDDAAVQAVLSSSIDIVLLGHNENLPDKVKPFSEGFVVPAFPYNAHAYCLSPIAARKLIALSSGAEFGIIPVDDWFAELLQDDKITMIATDKEMIVQTSREVLGSDIEPTGSDFLNNYNVHVLTCGTDRKKCTRLYDSAAHFNVYITNIGDNKEWSGTDMSGPGGGQKINMLKEYLEDIPDTDVVLFTDAYDVIYGDTLDSILSRWNSMEARVVFGAESTCWPDASLATEFSKDHGVYRYLNSGTFIGEVGEVKKILDGEIKNNEDDQLFIQEKYLKGTFDIKLDYEQYIFQTFDERVTWSGSQLYNPVTNCTGCIFHANGGEDAKHKMERLYKEGFGDTVRLDTQGLVDVIGPEMLVTKFATRAWCEKLIDLAEKHGGWEPLPGDLFPAQEIRLSELEGDIFKELEEFWKEQVDSICEAHWKPMQMYGIRDAFIMKYNPETQKELNLHTDASLVTGSIKLNDDYEGGELVFPRQGVSNNRVPVGNCILFPGMVTHGHECKEITKGTKYSLTIWTSRYEGDVQQT